MYWFHCRSVRPPAVAQIRWIAYWTLRFQSPVVPSSLPVASVRPSGLNATEWTLTLLPVRGRPSGRGRAGSAISHSPTVPSALPLASIRPPGLNATEYTAAVLPGKG